MKNQVEISITKLTEQVKDGMRKKEIAEFYSIPEFQVGKLLKQANLKIRKIHALGFVLVDDKQVEDVTLLNEFARMQEFVQEKHQDLATPEDFDLNEEIVTNGAEQNW